MNFADNFLNKITMYRLTLYYLFSLFLASVVLSLFHVLPYSPIWLVASSVFILTVCFIANFIFSKVLSVPVNVESVYITAMILFFLVTPPLSFLDFSYIGMAFWASVLGIGSKFLVSINKKHIFNPAAFGVAVLALALGLSASWWVGTASMAPFVLVGGLLLVRKIHRSDLVYSFFVVAVAATLAGYISSGIGLYSILQRIFLETPIMFLAFVMLTEPITTPPRAWSQMIYGAIAGFLFAPAVHIGSLYFTPELALLAGNIFSYAVSPKRRLILTLKEKKQIATGTYDFVFDSDEKMNFRAGQYLEWTLPHEKPDSRGNRRYFTIASSPTEQDLRLGVKFYSPSSSFKKKLLEMKPGEKLLASQLAGDFTLPADSKEKLVWIAGGIGVTPFRSMAKYLVDRGERRDVTMLYSSRTSADVAYADVFEEARQKIGLKTIYILSEAGTIKEAGQDAFVRVGQIDRAMIEMEIPDYRQRVFYISGPHAMVSIFQMTLQKMGVSRRKIVVDYFPGF